MNEDGLTAENPPEPQAAAKPGHVAVGRRPRGPGAAAPRRAQPPTGRTRRARLWAAAEARGIPLRAILTTVAVVVAVYLAGKVVYRLKDVILLMVVSGFIALLLNPLVVALQRWVGSRAVAVTIVTILAVAAFSGLAYAFGSPLVNGLTHLAEKLPGYVSQAEQGRGWVGHLVTKYHVQAWVTKNAPKLASYGQNLASPALTLGKGAVNLMITLFTIFVLVVLLMVEGPKMRTGLLGLMTANRAAVITRIAKEVNRSVTGYMLGNFATSIIAGVVVFVTLALMGVPFPFLWALWVALVDFLPMIGGALAGIPTILFAFFHSFTAGLVTLVVFLVYTQVENHILNPVIMSRTVRINPLLVLVSILVGVSLGSWVGGFFGGFVAALLSIPLGGAAQVIVVEVWRDTAPPPAPGVASLPGQEPAPPAASPEPPDPVGESPLVG
ncbi:MAG TPA: AI-2E family transporter [Streptosporangiaceae bacterium]|nr:AI-2E family transporter [Streptosporangiaceae bacterium]